MKHQLKVILVTQDGENFLCIREFYTNDLCTGKLIDGKCYQGSQFKLIKDTKQCLHDQPKSEQTI